MPETPCRPAPLIAAWTPEALPPSAFQDVLARARPEIPKLRDGLLFPQSVHGPTRARIDVMAAYSVQPHVDLDFDPWVALYVLEHAPDHALHAADHVCTGAYGMGRVPRTKPVERVPVAVGQILVFSGYRAHWLPRPATRRLFIAAHFSFVDEPSRETVEAQIRADLIAYTDDHSHAA